MLNNTKTQSRPKLLFLVPAISQTHKSLENSQDSFVKTKTKTLFFVLEAPQDQDFGLDSRGLYITGLSTIFMHSYKEPEVVVKYLDIIKLNWLC